MWNDVSGSWEEGCVFNTTSVYFEFTTMDSQGKYQFFFFKIYFGLLDRYKIFPPYLIDRKPHYPTDKQNYKTNSMVYLGYSY